MSSKELDDFQSPGAHWPSTEPRLRGCGKRLYDVGVGVLPVRKGSVSSCSFTLFACCIGIGILALPYTFSQIGLCVGLVMMAGVFLLNYYTSQLLVECAEATGKFSYDELASLCFGPVMQALTSVSVFLLYYGCLISFFAVLCELPTHAFKLLDWDYGILTSQYFIATALIVRYS